MIAVPTYPGVPGWVQQMLEEFCNDQQSYVADLKNLRVGVNEATYRWLQWIADTGRSLLAQHGQDQPPVAASALADRPGQVLALAGEIREDMAVAGALGLAAVDETRRQCQDIIGSWPQLDEIIACCAAGPGDPCPFCDSGDLFHTSEPQPVPQWAVEAVEAKLTAGLTLAAVELTLAPSDRESVELSRPAPSDKPPAPARPLPGGNMAHTMAAEHNRRHTLGHQRKHYTLEGHRFRRSGTADTADTISTGRPPLPEPPPPEDKPRRRRRRLR